MSTIFSKIVAGEIPCHKVAETENCLAFLDINPVRLGHTLCIPKAEVDYIFNLEDDALAELTLFSKKVARAVEQVFPCNRVGVTVIGLEVPHAHIHLIPIDKLTDMDFTKPKLNPGHEELAKIAEKLRSAF